MNLMIPILNFVGSLFPIVFPKNEFKPQRLGAVLAIIVTVSACVYFLGEDKTEFVIDKTEQVIELTEQSVK